MTTEPHIEHHTPQVSKRENAIEDVKMYLAGFIAATVPTMQMTDKAISILRAAAEDIYKIVKRAEGFDV